MLADAKGAVNQVIVSDWLKNSRGGESLADCSDLTDIENVKGYETFEKDEKGNITWQAARIFITEAVRTKRFPWK